LRHSNTESICIVPAGINVIIDRTNFDTAQRRDFLQLAKELGVAAHCVVLHLDLKLCVQRAVKRHNHEGDLQVHSNLAVPAR